jgi:hypothetical protein
MLACSPADVDLLILIESYTGHLEDDLVERRSFSTVELNVPVLIEYHSAEQNRQRVGNKFGGGDE